MTFRAFVVEKTDVGYRSGFKNLEVAELPNEKLLIDVAYSSLNYKDALAVSGTNQSVVRKFPMVCGIDLVGTVAESGDSRFRPGDKVVVVGGGLSETVWGGYSARMRVDPNLAVMLPPAFSEVQAMAIGTAGFTAMISVLTLEKSGVHPGQGEVIVSGAAGGVGSVAVALLSKLGHNVVASTGRVAAYDYLRSLGAAKCIPRKELDVSPNPLERARWAGGIDTVGGQTLASILSQTKPQGAIAACGLAGSSDLPTNMMPFILRGVKLLGINYFEIPKGWREMAWKRLETDLNLEKLDAMTEIEPLSSIEFLASKILRGNTRGRIVIDVNK